MITDPRFAARERLAIWSRGDVNAWLTQEAKAALRCLQRDGRSP